MTVHPKASMDPREGDEPPEFTIKIFIEFPLSPKETKIAVWIRAYKSSKYSRDCVINNEE